MVLATNGASPYKTVADVIAAAKAQPGTLNVCTPGYGSINQLVLESIALDTGTKFVHVPYKGGAPAAQALVAGDIPLRYSRKLLGRALRGERQYPGPGGNHRAAFAAQSGMADAEGEAARATSMPRTGPRSWRPRPYAAADHRQAQRRSRRNPRHAGRQGALCRRRRLDHSVESGANSTPRSSAKPPFTGVIIEKANVHVD